MATAPPTPLPPAPPPATHAQQQILEAVRAALAAGGTAAGARVYLDRPNRLAPADLPAILVEESPQGETASSATLGGADERQLSVLVTGVVQHKSGHAAAARALGLQIERVLGTRTLAAPRAGRLRLSASRLNVHGDAETLMAAREQIWIATYFTRRAEPDKPF